MGDIWLQPGRITGPSEGILMENICTSLLRHIQVAILDSLIQYALPIFPPRDFPISPAFSVLQ